MSRNIFFIATSLRMGRNSETLADAFIPGANEAGHKTEKICLYNKSRYNPGKSGIKKII